MRYIRYITSKGNIKKPFHPRDFKRFKWSFVRSVWNKFNWNVDNIYPVHRSWGSLRHRGRISGCIDGWTKGFLRQWVVSIHVVRPDSWLPRSLRHRSTTTCNTNNRTISSSFFCFILFLFFFLLGYSLISFDNTWFLLYRISALAQTVSAKWNIRSIPTIDNTIVNAAKCSCQIAV